MTAILRFRLFLRSGNIQKAKWQSCSKCSSDNSTLKTSIAPRIPTTTSEGASVVKGIGSLPVDEAAAGTIVELAAAGTMVLEAAAGTTVLEAAAGTVVELAAAGTTVLLAPAEGEAAGRSAVSS